MKKKIGIQRVYPIGDTTNASQAKMANYVYEIKKEPYPPEENPTTGILLCADKNDAIVEMTLPQGPKRIFASKYMTVLPDKETLRLLGRKHSDVPTARDLMKEEVDKEARRWAQVHLRAEPQRT